MTGHFCLDFPCWGLCANTDWICGLVQTIKVRKKTPMCEGCFYGSCGNIHKYLHFHYRIDLRPKKGFALPVSVSVHRRTKPHSQEIIFEFRIHYCNISTSRAWKSSSRQSCLKNSTPQSSLLCLITEGKTNISQTSFYKCLKFLPLISMNIGLT